MFKSITINLTGPICKCEYQDLAWAIILSEILPSGHCVYNLYVFCNICKNGLEIPSQDFIGNFRLQIPYPKSKVNLDKAEDIDQDIDSENPLLKDNDDDGIIM